MGCWGMGTGNSHGVLEGHTGECWGKVASTGE